MSGGRVGGGGRGRAEFWACLGVALGLRLLSWGALHEGGTTRLLTVDSYGHAQRITVAVREFPRLPSFDTFLAPPRGAVWIWPPLFDFVAALPIRALCGSAASFATVVAWGAWLPPLLGVLAVVLVRRLAGLLFGPAIARRAAWIAAVLPVAAVWSLYGHLDQHVAEVVALLAVARAWCGLLCDDRQSRARLAYCVAGLAAALAIAVLTWQGAIFLAAVVALGAWGIARPGAAALSLAGAAAVVAPFAALADGPFTYVSFGYFQPAFLAACAIVAGCAELQRRLEVTERRRRRWRFLPALAALLLVFTLTALVPPLRSAAAHLLIRGGAESSEQLHEGGYLSYPGTWLRLIAEYRPLWTLSLRDLFDRLSLAGLALPWALGAWVIDSLRRPRSDRSGDPLAAVALLGGTVLGLALTQHRYLYYLAPFVAIAGAERWESLRSLLAARGLGRARFAIAALAIASFVPGNLRNLRPAGPPSLDLVLTLDQLRQRTPSTVDPWLRSALAPGELESVMAPWAFGHLVSALTERPAVADNFGYGFFDQARFWTSGPEDDTRVAEWMRLNRVRFVLVGNLEPVLARYAAAVGRLDRPDSLGRRLYVSRSARPVEFLEEFVTSRTGSETAVGFVPQFRIYRRVDDAGVSPP